MLHDIHRPGPSWLARSLTVAFFLILAFLTQTASATLLTGPFNVCPESTVTVGTDGQTLFLSNGAEYPVPSALQPTADYSFSVPSTKLLQAVAAVPDLSCSGSQVYLYEIPDAPGQPLRPILTPLCLANRLAGQCHYSGLSTSSPQELSAFIEQRLPTSTEQYITWVNRNTGAVSSTPLTHQIDGGPALRWAPSGNAAFVQHDLLSGPGGSDWMLIDMCPNSMGTRLANFSNLGAGASASVIQTSPGVFVARVTHPDLPGGSSDVSLVDCLGPPPPPPPDRARLEVQLTGDGGGAVDGAPLIQCDSSGNPNRCVADWPMDHVVTLTVNPHPGSTFLGWSGDCAGFGNTAVTMDEDKVCIAEFDAEIADLGVTGDVASDDVVAGAPLSFNISVDNHGPEAASARLTVDLPEAVTFNPGASTVGCDATGQLVSCQIGEMQSGDTTQLVIATRLDADYRGSMPVSFSVGGTGIDGNASNDQHQLNLSVDARVNLSVAMRAPTGVAAGGLAAWQVEVTNTGPSSALGPDVLVSLPTAAGSTEQVACLPPRLAPGASTLLTLMRGIDPAEAPGTLLQASASVSAVELDATPGDNQGSASSTVGPATSPAPPGALRRVVAQGDQPPGAPAALGTLSAPAVDGQLVAFRANYGASTSGLYLSAGDGSAPLPVLDWNRASADGAGTIEAVLEPSLDGGRVASPVRVASLEQADGGGQHFYVGDDCGPRRIDDSGGVLGGTFLVDPTGQGAGPAAYVAVALQEQVMVSLNGFELTVAEVGDGMPGSAGSFDYFGVRPGWDGGSAAFFGSTFDLSSQGIYLWDEVNGVRRVADLSTVIPGRGETFASFGEQFDIDGGIVAFIGIDSQGREGLYVADAAEGGATFTLRVVADALNPAVGSGGQPVAITGFAQSYPSVAADQVAFYGGVAGQPFGLYVGPADGSQPARLIVAGGDDLGGGFLAGSMLFGPQGFDGERLAFQTWGFLPPSTLEQAIYVVELGRVEIFIDGFESGDTSNWSEVRP